MGLLIVAAAVVVTGVVLTLGELRRARVDHRRRN